MKRSFKEMRTMLKGLGYQLIKTGALMVWETDLRDKTSGRLVKVIGKQENFMTGEMQDVEYPNHKYVVRFCYNPILNTLYKDVEVRSNKKKVAELKTEVEDKCVEYLNRYNDTHLKYHYLQNWDNITHLTMEEQAEVYLETRQGKGKMVSQILDYTRRSI